MFYESWYNKCSTIGQLSNLREISGLCNFNEKNLLICREDKEMFTLSLLFPSFCTHCSRLYSSPALPWPWMYVHKSRIFRHMCISHFLQIHVFLRFLSFDDILLLLVCNIYFILIVRRGWYLGMSNLHQLEIFLGHKYRNKQNKLKKTFCTFPWNIIQHLYTLCAHLSFACIFSPNQGYCICQSPGIIKEKLTNLWFNSVKSFQFLIVGS